MKKKTLLFLISLCLCYSFAFAQDTNPWSVGISIGPSFPIGDFSNEEANGSSGYAKIGWNVELQANYDLHSNWGARLWLKNQNYEMNNAALENLLLEQILEEDLSAIEALFGPIDTDQISMQSAIDKWQLWTFMLGAYYRVPLKNCWELHPTIGLGLLHATSPEASLDLNYQTLSSTGTLDSETEIGFSSAIGLDLMYIINNHFTIQLNNQFQYANITFDDTESLAQFFDAEDQYTLHVMTLNTSLGIRYTF